MFDNLHLFAALFVLLVALMRSYCVAKKIGFYVENDSFIKIYITLAPTFAWVGMVFFAWCFSSQVEKIAAVAIIATATQILLLFGFLAWDSRREDYVFDDVPLPHQSVMAGGAASIAITVVLVAVGLVWFYADFVLLVPALLTVLGGQTLLALFILAAPSLLWYIYHFTCGWLAKSS